MTDAGGWARVTSVFQDALEREGVARVAYLDAACAGDAALRAEVESLLAAHNAAGSFAQGSPLDALPRSAVESLGVSLAPGARLGPYEIVGPLGAGGMGEVYEARDALLGRRVAIKILSAKVSLDESARDRLTREAKALAALNHPNIAVIYGLETTSTSGASAPMTALVLELVEGPTLAERVARGPVSIADALRIGAQIAVALEAAHEKGIIHRDLKPANIKITPTGTVKVLDFGLAKAALDPDLSLDGVTAMATVPGTVLGTPGYMSPEQVRGENVDKRADVWAFGCVLYELLSGRRAFAGLTMPDCIAAVLEHEPDWSALPHATPEGVCLLLRRCLQKGRAKRLRDIADAGFALEDALSPQGQVPIAPTPRKWWGLASTLSIGAVALGAYVTWTLAQPTNAPALPVMRLEIVPSDANPLNVSTPSGPLAISPDGRRVAYSSGRSPAGGPLMVRELGDLTPRELDTGTLVRDPFFSADGQWIGYWVGQPVNAIRKVPVAGGTPVTIVGSPDGAVRGASWSDDHTIVFATANPDTGLLRISDAGGTAVVLTTPSKDAGQFDHLHPWALPGGRGILFTIVAAGTNEPRVAVLDLRDNSQKVLIPGGASAQYIDAGFLLYAASGRLSAVRFNLDRLELEGEPLTLADDVLMANVGGAYFAVSRAGTIAFVPLAADTPRSLVWVDRSGDETPLEAAPARAYTSVKISPDGKQIAVSINDQRRDVWTWNMARKTLTQVTNDPAVDAYPLWMPDGQRLLFRSNRDGIEQLYWQSADGSDTVARLSPAPAVRLHPGSIAPAGEFLVGSMAQTDTWRLFVMPLRNAAPAKPLLERATGRFPALSPDAHFVAYQAMQSGLAVDTEIFVRPFPNVNDHLWKASTAGGSNPLWARNGRELFFLDRERKLTVVPLESRGLELSPSAPVPVLSASYWSGDGPHSYDVSADSTRFLMIKEDPTARRTGDRIVVVLNAFEPLFAGSARR